MRPVPSEPEILDFIDQVARFYPDDATGASVAQQRAWYDQLCRAFDPPPPAGLTWEDGTEAGIPVRRYRPATLHHDAVVLYLHGGGFVVGSRDSHHAICAELSAALGVALIAVDYRLAPEHRWPAPAEDCAAVLAALTGAGQSVILAGDSAGGQLAAGVALGAERGALRGLALIYPTLGGDTCAGSYVEMAEAPGLTTADVLYYRAILAAPADDPVANPLLAADLSHLPPTFVTAARFDPLRDDAAAFASRLIAADVACSYRCEPQMVHGWLRARHMSPGARAGFAALVHGMAGFLTP
ncbi:alpha/beta hydrolase [Halodurantibacterium flavum]|uniref:Alpha/beta hydrolase n=1 Tax=Halodurantibacterium flavum TaxID=1382802 RepID=A0ABW4S1S6_9RHOB